MQTGTSITPKAISIDNCRTGNLQQLKYQNETKAYMNFLIFVGPVSVHTISACQRISHATRLECRMIRK